MKKLFSKYIHFREEAQDNHITSKIKLQKKEGNKEFSPFTVSRSSHPNLRILIKAFQNSDKIGVGYTTIEKSKGEVEPQLKKKNLFLTGGAVRDHLKGKTPRNYDLVTDATPSEIRMILGHKENNFIEVKPKNKEFSSEKRYAKLPVAGSKNKVFYASRWDKLGKEIEMTVEINGEKFDLATLSKSPKSRSIVPDKSEPAGSVEDDSHNRDFTINALYIPLSTFDGDNTELIDPHGGAHHLKNGEVLAIGDKFEDRLKEDPLTALRYAKILSKYGNPDQISDRYKDLIKKYKDSIESSDKVRGDFLSGLENSDGDPRKYLSMFKTLGLFDKIYPVGDFDEEDAPEDMRGDRWMTSAWVMRNNDSEEIKNILIKSGWSKQEACDIAYLVKIYQWAKNKDFDPEMFYDLKKTPTGLTKNKIKEFMQMSKVHSPVIDTFLSHEDNDLSPYIDEDGKKKLNPEYSKILGRAPIGGEFQNLKKFLSTKRFKDALNKLK